MPCSSLPSTSTAGAPRAGAPPNKVGRRPRHPPRVASSRARRAPGARGRGSGRARPGRCSIAPALARDTAGAERRRPPPREQQRPRAGGLRGARDRSDVLGVFDLVERHDQRRAARRGSASAASRPSSGIASASRIRPWLRVPGGSFASSSDSGLHSIGTPAASARSWISSPAARRGRADPERAAAGGGGRAAPRARSESRRAPPWRRRMTRSQPASICRSGASPRSSVSGSSICG